MLALSLEQNDRNDEDECLLGLHSAVIAPIQERQGAKNGGTRRLPHNMRYRRLHLILAVILICLFICVPLAEAKQTHLAVQVQNNTGYEMTLVKSGDWSGEKSIRARDIEALQHKNTAWYNKTKKYDHDIVVKKGGNTYCKCDIWLKNKVTLVGDTKIIDEHYKSNDTKRCTLKKLQTTAPNEFLVLNLYIK